MAWLWRSSPHWRLDTSRGSRFMRGELDMPEPAGTDGSKHRDSAREPVVLRPEVDSNGTSGDRSTTGRPPKRPGLARAPQGPEAGLLADVATRLFGSR
jgi:hypothetical protein